MLCIYALALDTLFTIVDTFVEINRKINVKAIYIQYDR